jgi:hypothetical protein
MTPTTSSSVTIGDTIVTIGDTIVVPWRPEWPVKVTSTRYEAVHRLRAATIIAARRRSTITYGEAELAIDGLYIAQGLGPALDLLSYPSSGADRLPSSGLWTADGRPAGVRAY